MGEDNPAKEVRNKSFCSIEIPQCIKKKYHVPTGNGSVVKHRFKSCAQKGLVERKSNRVQQKKKFWTDNQMFRVSASLTGLGTWRSRSDKEREGVVIDACRINNKE